jgi:REP element-mobilizing transposase RayT
MHNTSVSMALLGRLGVISPSIMPTMPEFPFPKRYNTLRLPGFDYASPTAVYCLAAKAAAAGPIFADFALAKSTLASLLHEDDIRRIHLAAYTLLPDHLHIIGGTAGEGLSLSEALGFFKSYTTSVYWKRSREVFDGTAKRNHQDSEPINDPVLKKQLLAALMDWRAALRPEAVKLKGWPRVREQFFQSKQLWQVKFHDHIIRNQTDLRESIEYLVMNPVRRGYVSKPQYYPFTGLVSP